MIEGDRALAVITARGGSKGLPRKNLRELDGKPLIAWSIEAAAQSALLDRTVVSTDDTEIADVARRWGADVPFLRPSQLAGDTSAIVDAILHAVDNVPETYRYIVLLQATSPLRSRADIDAALTLCRRANAPACVSVTPAPKARWTLEMDEAGRLSLPQEIGTRRQELPDTYRPNGAVYVAELDWLRKKRDFYQPGVVGYVMPPERSLDIDTMMDFLLAEAVVQYRKTGGLDLAE